MSAIPNTLKLTFQLTVHDERLEVRATAPAGEGKAETVVPPRALLDRLAAHDVIKIPSSALESVGKALYQCLMVGDVARLASDVLQRGTRFKQPVRFELRFDADQVSLAQYPWEMIADDLGRFLVREGLVDVTRYITYPQPPPTFDAALHDMPFLRIVSQPSELPPITVIDLAVEKIETLRHATFEQFLHKLLIERMALWGLQFDGHGALVLQCRECDAVNALNAETCRKCGVPLSDAKQVGALAFERNGDVDWIPTEDFGSVLYNAKVQLALLLACETARVGDRLVFGGLAPGLILAGVPVVVGMQYPVLDDFANSFSNSFYAALLEQNDVLDALRTARRMNIRGAWYSPVLYLRHQKTTRVDEPVKSAYHTRNIDTAVPAEVQAGMDFLVRLWIRRPEAMPLTPEQLGKELGVPESVPISTGEVEADVKFEPVEGRKLRRGEVEVKLNSTHCNVTPESIKLFVDEHLDAPPAIFTVRTRRVGRAPLIFSVWQDGGQIASVIHYIQVIDSDSRPKVIIETETHTVPVQDAVAELLRESAELIQTDQTTRTMMPREDRDFDRLHPSCRLLPESPEIQPDTTMIVLVLDDRLALPHYTLSLKNRGGQDWHGTVKSTLRWLVVSPTDVTCPAGGEAVIDVTLGPKVSVFKKARTVKVDDAIRIEGRGQPLLVGVRLEIKAPVAVRPSLPVTPPPPKKVPEPVVTPLTGLTVDFGTVSDWSGPLPTREIRLSNSQAQVMEGTVRTTVPWLEVTPTTFSCPPGQEKVLTARLTKMAARLRTRQYDMKDAIEIKCGGQLHLIGARLDVVRVSPTVRALPPRKKVPEPVALAVDFGTVSDWSGPLPEREVRLQNSQAQVMEGTVRTTVPWLEVTPTSFSCPPGQEVVLTATLTGAAPRLRPKIYDVADALIIESSGKKHPVNARLVVAKVSPRRRVSPKMDRTQMKEIPPPDIVEPFGKVHYWDILDGSGRMIQATILMEVQVEGAKMGIAIDGSGSMQNLFGRPPQGIIPGIPNHVRPAAQAMSAYLAKKSADGKVVAVYWATGPAGKDIQVLGDLAVAEAEKFDFGPPDHYGTGTQLLPALEYFTDNQQRPDLYDVPWGMYVFITDGTIEDMDAVKQYCTQLAKDIDAGRRNDLKLIIIGLGDQVDEGQLDELDNLETGTDVDLWDAKLAVEMKDLSEIFAEVVDEGTIIVPYDGIVRDDRGNVVVDYRDTGLPGVLEFTLPSGAKSFTLEVGGQVVTQPLVPQGDHRESEM